MMAGERFHCLQQTTSIMTLMGTNDRDAGQGRVWKALLLSIPQSSRTHRGESIFGEWRPARLTILNCPPPVFKEAMGDGVTVGTNDITHKSPMTTDISSQVFHKLDWFDVDDRFACSFPGCFFQMMNFRTYDLLLLHSL